MTKILLKIHEINKTALNSQVTTLIRKTLLKTVIFYAEINFNDYH